MPTREEILASKTFKEEDFEIEKRFFYTLWGPEDNKARKLPLENKDITNILYRTTKALSLVVRHLHDKRKVLTENEIDDILFDVVS